MDLRGTPITALVTPVAHPGFYETSASISVLLLVVLGVQQHSFRAPTPSNRTILHPEPSWFDRLQDLAARLFVAGSFLYVTGISLGVLGGFFRDTHDFRFSVALLTFLQASLTLLEALM